MHSPRHMHTEAEVTSWLVREGGVGFGGGFCVVHLRGKTATTVSLSAELQTGQPALQKQSRLCIASRIFVQFNFIS